MDEKDVGLIIAGGYVSKETLDRFLGPAADYLGEGLRNLIKKAANNIGKIIKISCEKLGNQIKNEGQVNLRVLKNICDEGRFIEDAFTAEYFGGIMAASRDKKGDDAVLPFINLVKSMPSMQLKLHFIIYTIIAKHEFPNQNLSYNGLQLYVPFEEICESLSIKSDSPENYLLELIEGLAENKLIEDRYILKHRGLCKVRGDHSLSIKNCDDGIIVYLNIKGANLYMKALGMRTLPPEYVVTVDIDFKLSSSIKKELILPKYYKCSNVPVIEPIIMFKELQEKINDLESDVDDVKSNQDDLELDVDVIKDGLKDVKDSAKKTESNAKKKK